MGIPSYAKAALMLAAAHRNMRIGIGQNPPPRAPVIVRKHIDGPYIRYLDGSLEWLTWKDRLMTKLGWYDAWDLELFKFADPTHKTGAPRDGE